MLERDKPAFAAVLNGLAAIKPGAKLTQESLDVFWSALQGWTLDEFRSAAAHLATTTKFMPCPFDFAQLRRAGEQTAAEAWAAVLDNVRRGDYRDGHTIGGLADRVVRAMGGYQVLAMSNTATVHFREQRFAELWQQLSNAADVRAALPNLTTCLSRDTGPQPLAALLSRTSKPR